MQMSIVMILFFTTGWICKNASFCMEFVILDFEFLVISTCCIVKILLKIYKNYFCNCVRPDIYKLIGAHGCICELFWFRHSEQSEKSRSLR